MAVSESTIQIFISYRRIDGSRAARWLRLQLLHYRLPRKLEAFQKKTTVYLDTAYERATEDFWKNEIAPNLIRSRILIVLCTPSSLKALSDGSQNWLEREVDYFIEHKGEPEVVLAVAAGHKPESLLPARLNERMPQAEIINFNSLSNRLWRPRGRRRLLRDELIKVFAKVFEIPSEKMPILREEEEKRRRKKATIIISSIATLFIVFIALSYLVVLNSVETRRKSIKNNLMQGRSLMMSEPGLSRLYLAEAVSLSKPTDFWEMGITHDDSVARAQLGYWNGRNAPIILWHNGPVTHVTFHPKKDLVLTLGADRYARIWNTNTGELVKTYEHEKRAMSGAFSPDGKRMIIAFWGGLAQLWDVEAGVKIGGAIPHNINEHGKASPIFTSDSKMLVTTSGVWSAINGATISVFPKGQQPTRLGASGFSPDNANTLVAASNKTIYFWDILSGERLDKSLDYSINKHVALALFHPTKSNILASASWDNNGWLWNLASEPPAKIPLSHSGLVELVTFSPDGSFVLTAGWDETARLWRTDTGQALGKPMLHFGVVEDVIFSPDGKIIVTASRDGMVRLWFSSNTEMVIPPIFHDGPVMFVDFNYNGRKLASASEDGLVRIWDNSLWEQGRTIPHKGPSVPVFDEFGEWFVTSPPSGIAQVWSTKNDKPVTSILSSVLNNEAHNAWALAISKKKGLVFAVDYSNPGLLTGWNIPSGNLYGQSSIKSSYAPYGVNRIHFNPADDSKQIVALAMAGTPNVLVWNYDLLSQQPQVLPHKTTMMIKSEFSNDGKRLMTVTQNGEVKLWDTETWNELTESPIFLKGQISAADLSGIDGGLISIARYTPYRDFLIFDGLTGVQKGNSVSHGGNPKDVTFSPDGKKLLTASSDGTARLWSVGSAIELIATMRHNSYTVDQVSISACNRWIVSVAKGMARLWSVDSGRLFRMPFIESVRVEHAKVDPGCNYLMMSGRKFAKLISLAPAAGSAKQLKLEAEIFSVMTLDAVTNSPRLLTEEEWRQRNKALKLLNQSQTPLR